MCCQLFLRCRLGSCHHHCNSPDVLEMVDPHVHGWKEKLGMIVREALEWAMANSLTLCNLDVARILVVERKNLAETCISVPGEAGETRSIGSYSHCAFLTCFF